MDLAARRIEAGELDCAIIVAAESSRHVVERTVERLQAPTATLSDFKEAMPTLTLGSAAVAMLLVHADFASTTHRVFGTVVRTDPHSSRICLGTADWMRTDAALLLKNGVALAQATWADATARFGWTPENIDQFLCHQVGATHLATLCKRLELPVERAFLTYPELGNTGPAAVPMALALAETGWEHQPAVLSAGQRLALMGIGSGLGVAMMDVRW
jgi:acyl-CoA:acyl-CoA alkyltransferase